MARRPLARRFSVPGWQRQIQLVLAWRSAIARRGSARRFEGAGPRHRADASPNSRHSSFIQRGLEDSQPVARSRQCRPVSRALCLLPIAWALDPSVVHMNVQMDASRRPIRDIIAKLPGRNPDRWVVLGTHHDAWTFGGMDPGSGTSGVYETARSLAALAKQGWTPERSIVFAFLGCRRTRTGWLH